MAKGACGNNVHGHLNPIRVHAAANRGSKALARMWHSGAAAAGAMTCHPRHPQLPVPQQLQALMSTLHAPHAF